MKYDCAGGDFELFVVFFFSSRVEEFGNQWEYDNLAMIIQIIKNFSTIFSSRDKNRMPLRVDYEQSRISKQTMVNQGSDNKIGTPCAANIELNHSPLKIAKIHRKNLARNHTTRTRTPREQQGISRVP